MQRNGNDKDIDIDALNQRYEEERQKRLRNDGLGQYRSLTGEFAHLARDPRAETTLRREPQVRDTQVLIVGGGLGGLLVASRLREAGISEICIVERGGDFGGTWYWNRYPGAACDVESYIYMPLLEETGYIPSEKYAKASEIFAHCQRIANHYDLYAGALFQTSVTDATWNEDLNRWIVGTDRGDRITARFLISCKGLFTNPKLPAIPGIESFKGAMFHTSRWDYAYTGGSEDGGLVNLQDKRVAVIGTGSTGIQCIPALADWSGSLYIFQRTPSSIDKRGNRLTDPEWRARQEPGWQRQRMENFTLMTSGVTQPVDMVDDAWTDILAEIGSPTGGEVAVDPAELMAAQMRRMENVRKRIEAVVEDAATAEALKPYYHYFCKRPGFSDVYLETFNRPNVKLVDTGGKGVERVTPTGLVVAGQEYPIDCIVLATGFDFMTDYTREAGFDVVGMDGLKLSEHWGDGARTLFGVQTHGFPNYFMVTLLQAGVSINYVHTAQEQAEHIAYIISRCLSDKIDSVEPTAEAEAEWVEGVIAGSGDRRAFLDACIPGYYNYEGRREKSFALNEPFPGGPVTYFQRLARWREEGAMRGLAVRRKPA